jgi:hypothetical protein
MHGKTWAPGYVADFFAAVPWYIPDPAYAREALSDDEEQALAVLEEHVTTLLQPGFTEYAGTLAEREAASATTPAPAKSEHASSAPSGTRRGPDEREATKPGTATTPDDRERLPASGTTGTTASVAMPAAPQGPPVGHLRTAPEARLFLARETSRGPIAPARIREAILLVEAHEGRPFDDAPQLRQRFEGESWYHPRQDFGPDTLSLQAREVLTLLRRALETP